MVGPDYFQIGQSTLLNKTNNASHGASPCFYKDDAFKVVPFQPAMTPDMILSSAKVPSHRQTSSDINISLPDFA